MQYSLKNYSNMVGCGNCGNLVEVVKSDTCEECGMMICGNCGKYCRYHKDLENSGQEAQGESYGKTITVSSSTTS